MSVSVEMSMYIYMYAADGKMNRNCNNSKQSLLVTLSQLYVVPCAGHFYEATFGSTRTGLLTSEIYGR